MKHLVALAGSWSAWRNFELRSAGFPAEMVLELASAASVGDEIEQLGTHDARVTALRETAIADCVEQLATTFSAPSKERKLLKRVLERLRSGQAPAGEGAALEALRAASEARDQHRVHVESIFVADGRRISGNLRSIARDPRFREALTWQNRNAFHNALESLLRQPEGSTNASARQSEQLIASYLQRYCVKNDTIGFFGPDAWARIDDASFVARIAPAPSLLAARSVCIEYWCIDAIAAVLGALPELKPDLAPRRLPTIRLEGSTVHYPIAQTIELEEPYLGVLAACDGVTTARAIATRLGDETYDVLDELVEQRLIRWTLEIPPATKHPERLLALAIEALPGSESRAYASGVIQEIETRRDAVHAAAGDAEALGLALTAFDELFTEVTTEPAARRPGQMYAARTLLYEDTRRDIKLELGAGFTSKVARPLGLVMASARWYTHSVAGAYRQLFRRIFDELGGGTIGFLQYVEQLLPHFTGQYETAPTVAPVVDELHARWHALLAIAPDARHVERSSAELKPALDAAFAAPGPGWPLARYHSPDIMVAAASARAFEEGDFTCVVGEIHAGLHTYVWPLAQSHPDPTFLIPALRADLGQPLVAIVEPRAGALQTNRIHPMPEDIDIEMSDAKSWRPREQVLEVAQLVIAEDRGRLLARTLDGQRTFDLVELFESYLILAAATHFSLLGKSPHVPRISIDGVVVHRESWQLAADELSFLQLRGVDRVIGARRWAATRGIPRFIFVRVPDELKPCFVDLHSPVYVDSLARLLRQASQVSISEMLPTIDRTWLPDAEGQRYTAELRMAFVDPEPWARG